MPKEQLVKEILMQISEAIDTIRYRFEPVDSIDFFLDSPEGEEKLDSLCMLFIAIGESLKNVDKLTEKKLLVKYEHIDWKAIKGMRDVLSHHYFDMNAEAIYNVCDDDIIILQEAIDSMIKTI